MSAKSNYQTPYKKKRIEHSTMVKLYLLAYDLFAVTFAYFFALLIRFDFRFSMIPEIYLNGWLGFAPIYAIISVVVFWRFRLYKSIWRFASFTELQRIVASSIVTTLIHVLGITFFFLRMPISYYVIGAIGQMILVTAIRFSYRFVLLLRESRERNSAENVMVIGMHSIIGTT